MKSVGAIHAGNYNLKGKKTKVAVCGCCDVVDFREDYETERVEREELSTASIYDVDAECECNN